MTIVTSTARNKDDEMNPTPPLQMDLWPQEFVQTLEAFEHKQWSLCTSILYWSSEPHDKGFRVKFSGDL